ELGWGHGRYNLRGAPVVHGHRRAKVGGTRESAGYRQGGRKPARQCPRGRPAERRDRDDVVVRLPAVVQLHGALCRLGNRWVTSRQPLPPRKLAWRWAG